ncbi:hypothetical protein CYMTET_28019, partial [Cymbomonas tetramitiformis]
DGIWYYGLLLGKEPRGNLVVFSDGEIALCTNKETFYPKGNVESEEATSFVRSFSEQLAVCEGFETWLTTVNPKLHALYKTRDLPVSPGRSTELSMPELEGPAAVAGAAAANAAEAGAEETTAAKSDVAQADAAVVDAAAAGEAGSGAALAGAAEAVAATAGEAGSGAAQVVAAAAGAAGSGAALAGAAEAVAAAAGEAGSGTMEQPEDVLKLGTAVQSEPLLKPEDLLLRSSSKPRQRTASMAQWGALSNAVALKKHAHRTLLDVDLWAILQSWRQVWLEPGELLFKAGARASFLGIVLQGMVKLRTSDDNTPMIAMCSAGDFVGHWEFLRGEGGCRMHSARGAGRALVGVVSYKELEGLAGDCPDLLAALVMDMVQLGVRSTLRACRAAQMAFNQTVQRRRTSTIMQNIVVQHLRKEDEMLLSPAVMASLLYEAQGSTCWFGFSKEEAEVLVTFMDIRAYNAGDRVWTTGDVCRKMGLVVQGAVDLDQDGTPVGRLGRGSMFGELVLFLSVGRSKEILECATATCAAHGTRVLGFEVKQLTSLCKAHPSSASSSLDSRQAGEHHLQQLELVASPVERIPYSHDSTASLAKKAMSAQHRMMQADLKAPFTAHSLAGALDYAEVERLCNISRRAIFSPHAPLFLEGQIGRNVFLVIQGAVELKSAGGRLLQIRHAGDFAGEDAFAGVCRRSHSAFAGHSALILLVIRYKHLQSVLRLNPTLALRIQARMGEMLVTGLLNGLPDFPGQSKLVDCTCKELGEDLHKLKGLPLQERCVKDYQEAELEHAERVRRAHALKLAQAEKDAQDEKERLAKEGRPEIRIKQALTGAELLNQARQTGVPSSAKKGGSLFWRPAHHAGEERATEQLQGAPEGAPEERQHGHRRHAEERSPERQHDEDAAPGQSGAESGGSEAESDTGDSLQHGTSSAWQLHDEQFALKDRAVQEKKDKNELETEHEGNSTSSGQRRALQTKVQRSKLRRGEVTGKDADEVALRMTGLKASEGSDNRGSRRAARRAAGREVDVGTEDDDDDDDDDEASDPRSAAGAAEVRERAGRRAHHGDEKSRTAKRALAARRVEDDRHRRVIEASAMAASERPDGGAGRHRGGQKSKPKDTSQKNARKLGPELEPKPGPELEPEVDPETLWFVPDMTKAESKESYIRTRELEKQRRRRQLRIVYHRRNSAQALQGLIKDAPQDTAPEAEPHAEVHPGSGAPGPHTFSEQPAPATMRNRPLEHGGADMMVVGSRTCRTYTARSGSPLLARPGVLTAAEPLTPAALSFSPSPSKPPEALSSVPPVQLVRPMPISKAAAAREATERARLASDQAFKEEMSSEAEPILIPCKLQRDCENRPPPGPAMRRSEAADPMLKNPKWLEQEHVNTYAWGIRNAGSPEGVRPSEARETRHAQSATSDSTKRKETTRVLEGSASSSRLPTLSPSPGRPWTSPYAARVYEKQRPLELGGAYTERFGGLYTSHSTSQLHETSRRLEGTEKGKFGKYIGESHSFTDRVISTVRTKRKIALESGRKSRPLY